MENAGARRRLAANGRRHSATREMLLRMVEARGDGVSATALARATGLHENTVRGHLEQLRADGYLRHERDMAGGRGRPAWRWHATLRGPENSYAALAGVLAETLARTSGDPVGEARRAGRSWGRDILAARADADTSEHGGAAPESDVRETVVAVMGEQGFAPHDTGVDIVLHRCPLIEAATRHPDIVCAVHQGMIDAILAERGTHAHSCLMPFTAPGQCTLQVTP